MYEGDYADDKKHGPGVFTWASGNIYKGDFLDDQRMGNGQMLWTDGSMYEGEWQAGIQHGLGRMIFPDGTVKEGVFEHNIFKYAVDSAQALATKGANAMQNAMRSTHASTGFTGGTDGA